MARINCLFIGGPADGKIIGVPEHERTFLIQTMEPTPIKLDDVHTVAPFPIEHHAYRREWIGTATAEHAVFIYGPMTIDDALQLLLRQYAGEAVAVMPLELTGENGAKGALIGEFYETFGQSKVLVSWTTIKAIYRRCVDLFSKVRTGDKLPW